MFNKLFMPRTVCDMYVCYNIYELLIVTTFITFMYSLTTYITANKLFRLPIVNAVIITVDVYLISRRYVITFKSNSTPIVVNKTAT